MKAQNLQPYAFSCDICRAIIHGKAPIGVTPPLPKGWTVIDRRTERFRICSEACRIRLMRAEAAAELSGH